MGGERLVSSLRDYLRGQNAARARKLLIFLRTKLIDEDGHWPAIEYDLMVMPCKARRGGKEKAYVSYVPAEKALLLPVAMAWSNEHWEPVHDAFGTQMLVLARTYQIRQELLRNRFEPLFLSLKYEHVLEFTEDFHVKYIDSRKNAVLVPFGPSLQEIVSMQWDVDDYLIIGEKGLHRFNGQPSREGCRDQPFLSHN